MIKAKQKIISIVLIITLVFSNNIVVFAETTDNETNTVTGETTIDSSECVHEFEKCAGTDATCTTAGYIEYACVKCWDESVTYREEIPATGHTWDEGVVTTEPTTATEGIKTYTCSACGETKEESISVLESEENACPVASMSIDKKLMSKGETATITLVMNEGYSAEWIYLYKPITKNIITVYLYETDSGIYTGTFTVDEQTESGIWQVKYLTYTDSVTSFLYLYNSETYTGTTRDTISFSDIEFEVVGTNADVTAPVLTDFSIDKALVSAGEKVTISITIEDDNPKSEINFVYNSPSGDWETITLYKISNKLTYQGTFKIKEDTEVGIWKPRYLSLYDANGNGDSVYNSKVYPSYSSTIDLSSMTFEVISAENEGSAEEQDTYIVIFKDGFGNTLSTQKVTKGDSAIEPSAPTNELYLFNGWDCDFSNVIDNIIVTATWVLNPDVVYDKEGHIGSGFEIEVYSTSFWQKYTITCNEDIEFTSTLSSTGIVVTDGQSYYSKSYTITTDTPGSYLFYVEGSSSSNILTYKVKITNHEWSEEYTVDKEATCIEEGSQSIHCSICDIIQEGSEKTIPLSEHAWDEGQVTTESTCTEDGEKTYTCATCKNTKTEKIEATGHEWNDDYTVDTEPTCTDNGEKSIHCGICDSVKVDSVEKIEATGHTWGDPTILKKPTCTDNGEQVYACKCGTTESEEISALGHKWNNEYTVDGNPTCTQDGQKSIHCKTCGSKKEGSEIVLPAKGHNYGNWVITKQPTLSNEGLKIKTCKVCGDKVSQSIDKLKPEWKHNSKGYWYEYPDGSYPKSCWKKIDGYWYYFDASGYRETGWLKQKNIWYYLNSDGKMATGWKTVGSKKYYLNGSGAMQSGWLKLKSMWYYLGGSNDGAMKTGWQKISNKWYYFSKNDGTMQISWQTIGGKKYYLSSSQNDGSMKTGWQKISNIWYYFDKSGAMVTSQWVGNYYLKADGKMATSEWIGKYYVDSTGKWVSGKTK